MPYTTNPGTLQGINTDFIVCINRRVGTWLKNANSLPAFTETSTSVKINATNEPVL